MKKPPIRCFMYFYCICFTFIDSFSSISLEFQMQLICVEDTQTVIPHQSRVVYDSWYDVHSCICKYVRRFWCEFIGRTTTQQNNKNITPNNIYIICNGQQIFSINK